MRAEVALDDIEVARAIKQVTSPEHSQRRRLQSTTKQIERAEVRHVPLPRPVQRQEPVERPRRQPFVAREVSEAVARHVRMRLKARGTAFGEDRNLVSAIDQARYLVKNECLRQRRKLTQHEGD